MKIKKLIKILLIIILIFVAVAVIYLFVGKAKPADRVIWGVNFSTRQARLLELDSKKIFLSLLDDLKIKDFRLMAYWDYLEPEKNIYDFVDLDWQISQAENRNAKVILALGLKVPRWPECHIPDWAKNLSQSERENKILTVINEIVKRYKNSSAIKYWQVENEPFFLFGECPKFNEEFFAKEINLVKSLDPRPVIVTDSGEMPLWFKAAKYGDIVGITTYRKVWMDNFKFYFSYPIPSVFYARKAALINKIFEKKIIGVELQAEPWCTMKLSECPIDEQMKTLSLDRFNENIKFARDTGLSEFYLWGAEWWYYMKAVKNDSSYWNEAAKLFTN